MLSFVILGKGILLPMFPLVRINEEAKMKNLIRDVHRNVMIFLKEPNNCIELWAQKQG